MNDVHLAYVGNELVGSFRKPLTDRQVSAICFRYRAVLDEAHENPWGNGSAVVYNFVRIGKKRES